MRPGVSLWAEGFENLSRRAAEAVVERVARAAHGADRVGLAAAVERLAQPADVDVDGALVDIDLGAPHRVEQLGAREHPARPLHQELQQAVFGRADRHRLVVGEHALGGAIARGLFADIGWIEILVALLILLIIRPLAGWIGLTPGKTGPRERSVIAFFGVRGVGSLFYIAYATQNGYFPDGDRLWSIVGLVIVGSIIIHGLAATPTMRLIDATRHRATRRRGGDHTDVATTPV